MRSIVPLALWGIAPLSRLAGMLAWMCLYAYRYYYGNMTEDYTFCFSLIAHITLSACYWRHGSAGGMR